MAKNDKKASSETVDDTIDAVESTTETVEETDEKAKPEAKKSKADTEGLIHMSKDGGSLHVHPTTVDAHKVAGWTLA